MLRFREVIAFTMVQIVLGEILQDYGHHPLKPHSNYGLAPLSFTSHRDHPPSHGRSEADNLSNYIDASGENAQLYNEANEQEYIVNVSIQPPTDFLKKKFKSKLSPVEDYIMGSFLVAICFLSLAGNSIILLVFWLRQRRLSPVEVFLVNLGIVDVLLSLASYPMSTISSFKHQWDYGEIGCTFYGFTCYFLGLGSIFSVTGVAIVRYVMTCKTGQGNRITCWTSCKFILWGYLFALLWAILPLLGFGSYNVEPFGLSCTLDWTANDTASSVYISLVTTFCVFLPLFIIIFCYAKIILLVRQTNSLMQTKGVKKRNGKGTDLHLTWISGFVTLGFIVGWCPYSVASLWASFQGEVILPIWATPIPVILAKSSIAYNPFIYFFLTTRYQEDFKTVTKKLMTFTRRSETNDLQVENNRQGNYRNGNYENGQGQNSDDDTSGGGYVTSTTHFTAYYSTPPLLGKQEKTTLLVEDQVNDDNSSGDGEGHVLIQQGGGKTEASSCQSCKEIPSSVVTILEKSGTLTSVVSVKLGEGRKVSLRGSYRVPVTQEMEHQV